MNESMIESKSRLERKRACELLILPDAQDDCLFFSREVGQLVFGWFGQVDLIQHCIITQELILLEQMEKQGAWSSSVINAEKLV